MNKTITIQGKKKKKKNWSSVIWMHINTQMICWSSEGQPASSRKSNSLYRFFLPLMTPHFLSFSFFSLPFFNFLFFFSTAAVSRCELISPTKGHWRLTHRIPHLSWKHRQRANESLLCPLVCVSHWRYSCYNILSFTEGWIAERRCHFSLRVLPCSKGREWWHPSSR